MSRVKVSEYRAKKILLGESYKGVQLQSAIWELSSQMPGFRSLAPKSDLEIPDGHWVAKVDQGIKKRFKQGLVVIDKSAAETKAAIGEWEKKGFSQFILEPLLPHETSEEQYLSLERVREGIRMLHTKDGGIDIEAHPEKVLSYMIVGEGDVKKVAEDSGVPEDFLLQLCRTFDENFFAFLEINPLVVRGEEAHLLDAAALVDSAASFFVKSWSEDDIVKGKAKHPAEAHIDELAKTTPASLKLSVINPDGALFLLLSGGGGSIVIADQAELLGAGKLMANYGEYSGGPSREETYLYTKEVLGLCLASKAPKKAIVIAGGAANFTDVRSTFLGIVDALRERAEELRKAQVRIFVRRGGPNERAGLALMRDFLEKESLLGSIHGSDTIITQAIDDAIAFVQV